MTTPLLAFLPELVLLAGALAAFLTTLGDQRVTLAGPHGQANVRFAVSCGLGLTAKNDTRWRIRLVRGDDGRWRMSEAALLEVNGQPVVNMPGLP